MAHLILASTSPARQMLLRQAGLTFEIMRPEIDEENLKNTVVRNDPQALALELACAKVVSVANRFEDAIIIGADQVLNCDGEAFDKPGSIEMAGQQLKRLRGQEHWLETAICCARNGEVAWHHLARAKLIMRRFSDDFLARSLSTA